MSDFSTVIVSNDDCVSFGMSRPQETSPTVTVVKATAHVKTFFFFILELFMLLL